MPSYVDTNGNPSAHMIPKFETGTGVVPATEASYFKQSVNSVLQGNTIMVNPTDTSATAQTSFDI